MSEISESDEKSDALYDDMGKPREFLQPDTPSQQQEDEGNL